MIAVTQVRFISNYAKCDCVDNIQFTTSKRTKFLLVAIVSETNREAHAKLLLHVYMRIVDNA